MFTVFFMGLYKLHFSLVKSPFLCKTMSEKDAIIALCFLGSILLAILGGWNYMKGRILVYEQQVKIDKMLATRQPFLSEEEKLKEIGKEKTTALIMFAAGFTGIFIVISYTSRRRKMNRFIQHTKTRQP